MLKCPGTIGTTFAKIIAAVTTSPKMAAMRLGNRGFMRQYEAQVAIQPTAAATAPTSRIGTRPASPRSRARADAIPTAITALEGVRFDAWTYPIRGASSCLRPMANSRREAATIFALYVRNTATSADAKIKLTIQFECRACRKATAVGNCWLLSRDCHGATYATARITTQ